MIKYGNIIYGRDGGMQNMGEQMQLLAIENMYRNMGVDYSKVVRVELSDLDTYDGEKIILPINIALAGYRRGGADYMLFSKDISNIFRSEYICGNAAGKGHHLLETVFTNWLQGLPDISDNAEISHSGVFIWVYDIDISKMLGKQRTKESNLC